MGQANPHLETTELTASLPARPTAVLDGRPLTLLGSTSFRSRLSPTYIGEVVAWKLYGLLFTIIRTLLTVTFASAVFFAARRVQGRRWKTLAFASGVGAYTGGLIHVGRRQRRVTSFLVANTGNILLDQGVAAYEARDIDRAMDIFSKLAEEGQPGIAAKALVNRALVLQAIGDARAKEALRHALFVSTGVPADSFDQFTEDERAIISALAARGRIESSELAAATLLSLCDIDRIAWGLIERSLVEPSRGPTGRRYLELMTMKTPATT